MIDVLSKYAWVAPLKSKTGKAVTAVLESILQRSGGRHPHRLQTDKGQEFYNTTFAKMLDGYGIPHFSTQGDAKASVVVQSDPERTDVPILYSPRHARLRVSPTSVSGWL